MKFRGAPAIAVLSFCTSLIAETPGVPVFAPGGPYFTAGEQATAMAVADLNGDGLPDVITADYFCNNIRTICTNVGGVSVLIKDGKGTFKQAVGYPTDQPISVTLADVNGDKRPDILLEGYGGPSGSELAVLINNGNGTFQPAVSYPTAGGKYLTVGLVDNKDPFPDIAIATGNPGDPLVILRNNTDGTFRQNASPSVEIAGAIVLGDFTGDGKADLLVSACDILPGCTTTTPNLLLGNGDGSFQNPVPVNLGRKVSLLDKGDFDRDGKLDLLVINSQNSVAVLLGNGDGTFHAPVGTSASYAPTTTSYGIGDVNGDGKPDIVALSALPTFNPSGVDLLLNKGNGTFVVQTLFPQGINDGTEPFSAVVVGDFNNDKRLDFAVLMPCQFTSTNDCSLENIDRRGAAFVYSNTSPYIAPTSLTFATQLTGSTSASKRVSLFNTSTVPVTVSGVSITGDYSIASNFCTKGVAPGTHCDVYVTFKPSTIGIRSGSLKFTDDASNRNLHVASLKGTGTVVSVTPTSLAFGSIAIGTTSLARSVMVTNHGAGILSFSGISISGGAASDFNKTTTCGSSLGAGMSCSISVKFKPSMKGTRSTTLNVNDNGGGSPQKVMLTGTGT